MYLNVILVKGTCLNHGRHRLHQAAQVGALHGVRNPREEILEDRLMACLGRMAQRRSMDVPNVERSVERCSRVQSEIKTKLQPRK